MAINLLHEQPLNAYLIDLVYQGGNIPQQQSYNGEFESPDYVEQHRDEIIKGILLQYIKLKFRKSLLSLENEPAFVEVDKNRDDLPAWTSDIFERGENIYEFDGTKMSQKLRDEITMIRDFLYDEAGVYVDKVIRIARETKKKPKIRYDYLKTSNEYNTFEKALESAKHWHENMEAELSRRNKGRELLQKSLAGVTHLMDLRDGLSVYQLNTTEALDFESEYMGHCVGKGGYDEGVKNGTIQIYSIRDEKGEPHATFEVRDGKVKQCKGKSNKRPIQKYIPAIQEFVQRKNLEIENDAYNMGFLKINGTCYDILHLPKDLVVEGDIDLSNKDIEELPDMSNWVVKGNFSCNNNKLTNLRGAPKSVGGKFVCSSNLLISLDGAPKDIGWDFECENNMLLSLDGAPKVVGGRFNCSNNHLTSLVGAPQTVKAFNCDNNHLTSLEGAPQNVEQDFRCSHNQLTSLVGAPKSVEDLFDCSENKLESLKGAPQSVRDFNCYDNQITSLEGAPEVIIGDFICSQNRLTTLEGGPKVVKGMYQCSYNKLENLKGAPQTDLVDFYCTFNNLTSLEGAPQHPRDFDCSANHLTNLIGGPQKARKFCCKDNQLTSLEGGPQQVSEDYDCSNNQLTNLRGAPQECVNFFCYSNKLTSLEGGPRKVTGYYDCGKNQLVTLIGAPQQVDFTFNCCENQLTSLEGAPQVVKNFYCRHNLLKDLKGAPKTCGYFDCGYNQLTSLEGAPQKVDGDFNCSRGNQLTSLEGAPQYVGGGFDCSYTGLTSLEGAPQKVGGDFNCNCNYLTSLEGAPQYVERDFKCSFNKLINLYGAPVKVGRNIECDNNPLRSFDGASPDILPLIIFKDEFVTDTDVIEPAPVEEIKPEVPVIEEASEEQLVEEKTNTTDIKSLIERGIDRVRKRLVEIGLLEKRKASGGYGKE